MSVSVQGPEVRMSGVLLLVAWGTVWGLAAAATSPRGARTSPNQSQRLVQRAAVQDATVQDAMMCIMT